MNIQWYEKRIAQLEAERDRLLALVAKKDEALQVIASGGAGKYQWSLTKAEKLSQQALALTVNDVELVEVGNFILHEDKHGTRYPSSQMSYSYDEFEIGALNKLYTIVEGKAE